MNYRDYWVEPDNKLDFLRGTDISAYFGQLMDVMKQFIMKRLSDIEIDPATVLLSQRMAVNERMMRTPRNILNSPRPILYLNGSLIDNVSYQGAMSANQFLGDRQFKNIDAIGTLLFYKNDYSNTDDNSRNKALYMIPYSYKFNFEFTIIVDTLYYARNIANDLSTVFTEENTDEISVTLVSFLSKRSYRRIVEPYGIDVNNIDACRAFIDELSPYNIYITKNPGTGVDELAFTMEHDVNLLPRAEIESSSTPTDGNKYPIRFGMDIEINLPRDYVYRTFRPFRAPLTLSDGSAYNGVTPQGEQSIYSTSEYYKFMDDIIKRLGENLKEFLGGGDLPPEIEKLIVEKYSKFVDENGRIILGGDSGDVVARLFLAADEESFKAASEEFRAMIAPKDMDNIGANMPESIMTKKESIGTFRKITEISFSVVNEETDYRVDLKALETYFLKGQVDNVLLITDRLDDVIELLGYTTDLFTARITFEGEELYYGKLITFDLPTHIKKDSAVLVELYLDFSLYKVTYNKLPREGRYKSRDMIF